MTPPKSPSIPHVYAAERRALQQMNDGGLWYHHDFRDVRFTSDGCEWVLGQDGKWRWGDERITQDPQIEQLNRIRRRVSAAARERT
jgi:hypothetical protein